MPSTLAKPSFGMRLQVGDSSGSTFVDVAEVTDVKWKESAQIEDVTAHDTGVPWRSRIPTLLSYGPVTISVNEVPLNATHNATAGLKYIFRNRLERQYKLVDPDGEETETFYAIISDIDHERTVAGTKKANYTFQGSGAPTTS